MRVTGSRMSILNGRPLSQHSTYKLYIETLQMNLVMKNLAKLYHENVSDPIFNAYDMSIQLLKFRWEGELILYMYHPPLAP